MIWRLAPLWFALCLWSAVVILFTFTTAVVNSEQWSVSLAHSCSFWFLWLFIFPFIIWLSLRFPLEQSKLFSQISLHLAACIAIVIMIQTAYRTFLTFPSPPPPQGQVLPDMQTPPRPMGSPGMRVAPDVLIYFMAMSACVAFAHFRKSQERERRAIELEARLAQAKLQALRMQINPHFLFNVKTF